MVDGGQLGRTPLIRWHDRGEVEKPDHSDQAWRTLCCLGFQILPAITPGTRGWQSKWTSPSCRLGDLQPGLPSPYPPSSKPGYHWSGPDGYDHAGETGWAHPGGSYSLSFWTPLSEVSPQPNVLSCPAVFATIALSFSIKSITWDVYTGACVPFNSSMKERFGWVVEPNDNICLSCWAPYRAYPVGVASLLGVEISEMFDESSGVFSNCSAEAPIRSLESDESMFPEGPVMSTSSDR